MTTNWMEGLEEIGQRILNQQKTGDTEKRKPRRVRTRKQVPTKTKRHVESINRPFARLGEKLKNLNSKKDEKGKIVRKYDVAGGSDNTETVMIQSSYSIDELERLINGVAGLSKLIAKIESFDGAYYQIEMAKEFVMGGGMAAQRSRLEVLGRVIAHAATGLQKGWSFEEEEDLGYY